MNGQTVANLTGSDTQTETVEGDGDTRELTFHHHQRIADAGLVYVGARWYSPRLRRFISPDPVGVPDAAVTGVNRFHYGLDNPLAYTDPESPLAILGGGLVLYGAWEAGWAFGEAINNILNDPSTVLQELGKAAGTASLGLVTRKLEKFIPKGFWGRGTKKAKPGSYTPDRQLPTDGRDYIPDSDLPHTQLGRSKPKYGSEPQARTWGYDDSGNLIPKKDIDFTDHGFPDQHYWVPHQHRLVPNNPKTAPRGGFKRLDGEPLDYD
nr:RHS repeat-associated core domain-containing protein [Gynuella sunshinyii]